MAKSRKKKSVAQDVVDTAALALPAPMRIIVGSRWGSRLAVLVVLALLATGIATVDWTSGRPQLKINRERAAEVRQEVRHEFDERMAAYSKPPAHQLPSLDKLTGQAEHQKPLDEIKTIGARIFKGQK